MSKHTPGPWEWRFFGDKLTLCTVGRGCIIVMDFIRKGMNGATARFGMERTSTDRAGVMRLAEEVDLDTHPDARLLKAAPELLATAKSARDLYDRLALGTLEAAAKYGPDYEPPSDADMLKVRGDLEAAITKAELVT